MSQVSKRYLSSDVQGRMFEILIKAIGKANNTNTVVSFLTDLLSPTERTMLAKRLAIAYLLIQDKYSQRDITEILKVSLGTVHKISTVLAAQGKGYKDVVKSLTQEEQIQDFMHKVVDVLSSVPPKGQSWSKWRREQEIEKRSRTKVF